MPNTRATRQAALQRWQVDWQRVVETLPGRRSRR
jgi:hypothetical protein